jgi:hypothetical protein
MNKKEPQFLNDVWQSDEVRGRKKEFYKARGDASKRDFSHEPSLREWKHWRLIDNLFIYDGIADKHDMLIPKRVFPDLLDANAQEFEELRIIKSQLGSEGEYHVFIESLPENTSRSIKSHCHLHVIGKKMKKAEKKSIWKRIFG